MSGSEIRSYRSLGSDCNDKSIVGIKSQATPRPFGASPLPIFGVSYLCRNFSLESEHHDDGVRAASSAISLSGPGLAWRLARIKFNKYIENESNPVFRGSCKANANKSPGHRDLENIKFISKGD